ncbi:MAG: T9SS type A sorting domain-containing protein [Chlorobiota bacterium]
MKYIIYLALFTFAFCNLSSLEPELYSPEDYVTKSFFNWFHEYNDEVYVVGRQGTDSNQIWKFDGSEKGLELVTNLDKSKYLDPTILGNVNGKLLFSTAADGYESTVIWSTGGTLESTEIVKKIDMHYYSFMNNIKYESYHFIFDNIYYFIIYNQDKVAYELWGTDGTAKNTYNYNEKYNLHSLLVQVVGDRLVFREYSSEDGITNTLYEFGVDGSTTKLIEIPNSYSELHNSWQTPKVSKLFFNNKVDADSDVQNLWSTDGTPEGTFNLIGETDSLSFLRDIANFSELNGKYLITARDERADHNTEMKLIITDGTSSNVTILDDSFFNKKVYQIGLIRQIGNKQMFTIGNNSNELWSTDGTKEGTHKLLSGDTVRSGIYYYSIVPLESYFYFEYENKYGQSKLGRSNGTPNSTEEVINLSKNVTIPIKEYMQTAYKSFDNKIILIADQQNIHFYDRLTQKLEYIHTFEDGSMRDLYVYDDILYMNWDRRLYFYNEHQNKLEEIINADASERVDHYSDPFYYKNHVYFYADYYGNNEFKLYRIDNTFQTVSSVETQPAEEVNLYPNPTGDMLNISVDEPTSVSIIDLTGKVVMSIGNYHGEGINTSNLPAGVYNIILDENTHGGKFVKE